MALLITGLWQLSIAVIVFFNISGALPSVERHQRQVELKLMHDAGMRREYEKTVKLLQEMLDYKRSRANRTCTAFYDEGAVLNAASSVPNTAGAKDASDFIDSHNSWNSEEKLIKLKACLLIVQNLDARFPGSDAKDTTPVISRSICQLIVELNEAASGAPDDENQE